ncbi:MAG: Gfo/Idh/MocA family oxidoreductase [Pseudomonadota bacterium]
MTNAFAAEAPVRIGVVGLTHTHVHWVFESAKREDFEIVGIVEANRELAKRYSEQHGFDMALVYDSIDTMLTAAKPEGVTAFGTIRQHLSVVEAAAPRGVHVMVEKPLAVSLDHAQKMAALARQHNIHLLTNYETTWYPSNHAVYEIAARGEIGDVRKVLVRDGHRGPVKLGINDEFLDWLLDPKENGAGALFDFGCYGANLMTWLMNGERPTSVTAVVQQLQPDNHPEVDDEATIILTYPTAQAVIQASWNWPIGRKDLEVYGLTGVAYADNRNNIRVRIAQDYDDFDETAKTLSERDPPWHDPFVLFGAVIRGEVTLSSNDLTALENNLTVMEILDAALLSARAGETVRVTADH